MILRSASVNSLALASSAAEALCGLPLGHHLDHLGCACSRWRLSLSCSIILFVERFFLLQAGILLASSFIST
jgi:hypothetical protein